MYGTLLTLDFQRNTLQYYCNRACSYHPLEMANRKKLNTFLIIFYVGIQFHNCVNKK